MSLREDADLIPLSREQEKVYRIAALLFTVPGWNRNYTATNDAAKWIAEEAVRIGWDLQILDAAQKAIDEGMEGPRVTRADAPSPLRAEGAPSEGARLG